MLDNIDKEVFMHAQLFLTLWNTWVFPARILEWVTISYSMDGVIFPIQGWNCISDVLRDQTLSLAGVFFTNESQGKPRKINLYDY